MQKQAYEYRLSKARDSQAVTRFELRGNNAVVQAEFNEPTFLVGAAGTGKTLAWCILLDTLLRKYARSRGLIVRKVRKDLTQSALVTYERDVLGLDNPICSNQRRDNRTSYHYPNGSELVVAGLDRPGAALSAEYDFILMIEAVEFEESDYETLRSRNRNFVAPVQMIFGDANPSHPRHWLKRLGDAGTVRLLPSYHTDNPKYWDAEKSEWTHEGVVYVLGILANLTGTRRQRFYDGKWVQAEGAVYADYDSAIHLIDAFEIPKGWNRYRVIDFGFKNPFTCQWYAEDNDGRLYLYRELYYTQRLVSDHAQQINALSAGERYVVTLADHDAEDRATLAREGIHTVAADKDIATGIQAAQARFKVQADGRPRIFFMRGALVEPDPELARAKYPMCLIEEIDGYIWTPEKEGVSVKEIPVKLHDHSMDAMRYLCKYFDRPTPDFSQILQINL